ncbi:hypothetical protein RDABS01_009223 [Bienertia sinuspersici]
MRSLRLTVRDGDKNTSYFHHKASQRRRRNIVEGLYNVDGVCQEEEEDLEKIFDNYFTDIFSTGNPTEDNMAGWNEEVIVTHFEEEDQKRTMAIPLSIRNPPDSPMWAFTKEGAYSVKTAYMLGKGCDLDRFHRAWIELWNMDAAPKVRHFWWRMCTNTLPTRSLLAYRHIAENVGCPWCGETETITHAIFECRRVEELWHDSGCNDLRERLADNFCDSLVAWKACSRSMRQKGLYIAWVIWFERNLKVFNDKTTPNDVLLARIDRLVAEHGSYTKRIYGSPKTNGSLKINTDASLAVEGWVGLGAVVRDSRGVVVAAAVRRVRAWWPAEVAEAKAVLMAVKLARDLGLKEVIMESDSQVLIHRLSKAAIFFTELDAVLEDILSLSHNFDSFVLSHVKREGNYVAHHLARLVPFGLQQTWVNACPIEVNPYVLSDALSLD